MAELFGSFDRGQIDSDIVARTIGLHRVAKKMYAALPEGSEEKAILDAYADGISQCNARLVTGDEKLSSAMVALPAEAFQPWDGADILAVARLQSENLSFTGTEEIAQSEFNAKALAAFGTPPTNPRAGILVDLIRFAPLEASKILSGFPNDGAHTQSGSHTLPLAAAHTKPGPAVHVPLSAFAGADAFIDAERKQRSILGERPFTGSNNWVVRGARTTTGHAMLASDPHLTLSAPAVFYMVHLNVTDAQGDKSKNLNASGLAFPGIPGIILGHNDHVAWGATVANYDVTDVYSEELTPDLTAVKFKGQSVPIEKIRETIKVGGGDAVEYDILNVPHHGPLMPQIADHRPKAPDPAKGAISIKWTGMQPTNEFAAVLGFMRAKNVDDARVAMRNFEVGAQNWVFADTDGNIFYSSQSKVPKRDVRAFTGWNPSTFTGAIPAFVLPGDGSAEWTGFLDEAYIPHAKNPPGDFVATANNDQVGITFDNNPTNKRLPNGDPVYLNGLGYDAGYRHARIKKRIEDVGNRMTLDEMASIQSDARSAVGAALTSKILEALQRAREATSTTNPELAALVAGRPPALFDEIRDVLTRWGTETNYDAASGMSPENNQPVDNAKEALASKATVIFNAWLVRMIRATFGDEFAAMGVTRAPYDLRKLLVDLMTADPSTLATKEALFDDLGTTAKVETRDERIVFSLLDAIDYLNGRLGGDRTKWRWGALHTVSFDALVPLWGRLSIPPSGDPVFPNGFPRHGDGYNVDVAAYRIQVQEWKDVSFSYSHGPTQRFVIDMDPAGPKARNALPGGAIWDNRDDNPHFRDEAELWRRNKNAPVSFTHDDVKTEAESRTLYTQPQRAK
ncbi:penicillin acylase family protein [Pendulispora albinea]|uniref:Penicillin acylase family protein n=1 Tax=Pendulispora albinea TaxID=2741071 RepID=A0ABZ2M8W5_9BACT